MNIDKFSLYEDLGRILHEANRTLCIVLGDNSQVPWNVAPEWQKESIRQGIDFIIDLIENGNEVIWNAEVCHNNWLENKKAAGWKFGPVKDEEKKEHPCIVPFEALHQWQRLKDHIFVAIITGFHECIRNSNMTISDFK